MRKAKMSEDYKLQKTHVRVTKNCKKFSKAAAASRGASWRTYARQPCVSQPAPVTHILGSRNPRNTCFLQ